MRIVTCSEMRDLEREAREHFGLSETLIIENVGFQGADHVWREHLRDRRFGEVLCLIGPGNNGADGLAIARHLVIRDVPVRAFLIAPESAYSIEMKRQLEMARAYGVRLSSLGPANELESYFNQMESDHVVLDAMFGTGTHLPLSNYVAEIVQIANEHAHVIVSVDIPSGVMGDDGRVQGLAIHAHDTLAIGAPKMGHYVSMGPCHSGRIVVLNAGFPPSLFESGECFLLQHHDAKELLNERSLFSHKNQFGHMLAIGGQRGHTGALTLACHAALRMGTGLVTGMTWDKSYHEFVSNGVWPEVMKESLSTDETQNDVGLLTSRWNQYAAVVIGPGLGVGRESRMLVEEVLRHYYGPLVLDADALNMLHFPEDEDKLSSRKAPTVLTPHPGEFARMLGVRIDDVRERPIPLVKDFVERSGCALILKGHTTIVAFPGPVVFVHSSPNDGMATAGSGDVLAGLVGGALAQEKLLQHLPHIFEDRDHVFARQVCLSVLVHSLCGESARVQYGSRAMTSSSLIEALPSVFSSLDSMD